MSATRFEFTIDADRMLRRVPIPRRMNKELQEQWNKIEVRKGSKKHDKKVAKKKRARGALYLHRGTENKEYPVRLWHDFVGPMKVDSFLAKGWSDFVVSNKLRLFDRVQLLLEDPDTMQYRVRIWRSDTEITVRDPRVLIENDGSISDVDSTEFVLMEVIFKPPSFTYTFTKGYLDQPKIFIPASFAREHFQDLQDPTPVALYVSELYVTRKWDATMRLTFNKYNQIMTCFIPKGVPEMVAGEGVVAGEKVLVELEGMEPVQFSLKFT